MAIEEREDARNPDPKQWWEVYFGIWAKGAKMRDIELGFVEESSINPDLKELFENEKKELYGPLAESAFIKNLMDYDAIKFKDRVLDTLVYLEKQGKTKDAKWEPLADIPRTTMLIMQGKDVKLNLMIALERQNKMMDEEYMKARAEANKYREEIKGMKIEQREKVETIRKSSKEVEERREEEEKERRDEEEEKSKGSKEIDWQSGYGRELRKIAEKEEITRKKLDFVLGRQEERIAKEMELEQGNSKEYNKLLEKLFDQGIAERPNELEDIKKRLEKLNKNQEDRLAREKHGVDITKSLEDIREVQVLLVKRQEERIVKEGVQGKMKDEKEREQDRRDSKQEKEIKSGIETDTSQDEKIHQLRNELDSLKLIVMFNLGLIIIVMLAFGYFVLSR